MVATGIVTRSHHAASHRQQHHQRQHDAAFDADRDEFGVGLAQQLGWAGAADDEHVVPVNVQRCNRAPNVPALAFQALPGADDVTRADRKAFAHHALLCGQEPEVVAVVGVTRLRPEHGRLHDGAPRTRGDVHDADGVRELCAASRRVVEILAQLTERKAQPLVERDVTLGAPHKIDRIHVILLQQGCYFYYTI